MHLLYYKTFHIIAMVAWFAAIFFLGRMYIYHREALEKEPSDKSIITLCEGAEKRTIFIILIPSIIKTVIFGSLLAYHTLAYLQLWFHIKFSLVIIFLYYTHYMIKIRKKFLLEKKVPKVWQLRLLNEIPFILLIAITFIVYLKDIYSTFWALGSICLFIVLFMTIKWFQKKSKNQKK